jgi:hypothetical protein
MRKEKTQQKLSVRILESQCQSGHWYFWIKKTSMSFCNTKKPFRRICKFYPTPFSPFTTEMIAPFTKAPRMAHFTNWKIPLTNREMKLSHCFSAIWKSILLS